METSIDNYPPEEFHCSNSVFGNRSYLCPLGGCPVFITSLIVHLLLLYGALKLALWCKTGEATARSTAICTSQKTIPITVAIWSSTFTAFPLALLPGIVFHLCQIYCDGIIAKKWSRREEGIRQQYQCDTTGHGVECWSNPWR